LPLSFNDMSASRALFYFCISLIIGIALESLIKIPAIFVWGFLIIGAVGVIASFFKKETMVISFCLLGLTLGITRLQISEFIIANDALSRFNDMPQKMVLVGKIISEPDVRATTQKLTIEIKNPDGSRSLILVTSGRYADYHYLDIIQVNGKLKTPIITDEFNYKNYLAKDRVYSVMDYPAIEIVSQQHDYTMFSYAYEKILFAKAALMDSINYHFSPPQSHILQGMVFGSDKTMPKDLKDTFTNTGLSHVTAVSGTNIIILINMVMIFLLFLGFWRGQAFYLAIIFIWLYIALIGFPASGVRAAMMGCTGLLAQKLGRQNTGSRVLVATAAVMLLENPLLLPYDIGFQLSFLASLGIIHIKPLMDNIIYAVSFTKKSEDKKEITKSQGTLKFFLDILSITLAAQIITLPIMVYNFGVVSLIAPITNLLALPVVELLTVLGFLTSLAGVFSNILGFIFSIPCYLLLWYFLTVLDLFSQPWATKTIQHISWIWVAAYYMVLFIVIWIGKRYQATKSLPY
jgi:competence protein ComEC